jgi:hypothetical protein
VRRQLRVETHRSLGGRELTVSQIFPKLAQTAHQFAAPAKFSDGVAEQPQYSRTLPQPKFAFLLAMRAQYLETDTQVLL